MQQEMVPQQASRSTLSSALKFLVPAMVVFVLLTGYFAFQSLGGMSLLNPNGAVPRSQAIEDKWGIRLTQIAVTADGGMVDLRYIVINPDKALNLFENDTTTPVVVAEKSGNVVSAAVPMAHKHDLTAGVIYFVLFHNTNGAIKPGDRVSMVIGDLKLEHVVAK